MNKLEFLSRLQTYLTFMDIVERNQTLEFYAEQIDDRIDDGMTELQAVASLEAPEDIAVNLQRMRLNVDALEAHPIQATQSCASVHAGQDLTSPAPTTSASSPLLKWIVVALIVLVTSPLWLSVLGALLGIGLGIFFGLIAFICAGFGVAVGGIALIMSSITQFCVQQDVLARLGYGGIILIGLGVVCLSIVTIYVLVRCIAFICTSGARGISHAIDRWRASRKRKKDALLASAPIAHPYPPAVTASDTMPVSTPSNSYPGQPPHPASFDLPNHPKQQIGTSFDPHTSNGHHAILSQPLMVVEPGAQPQLVGQSPTSINRQEVHHD